MKTLLLILFILTTHAGFTQSDVPLYNSEGDATHYLDVSSNIIFSYRGDPASYLERNTLKDLCIYSFSGNHLGWYENGIVRSHEGKIVAFRKGAVTNVMVKMLPMKALPKMVPPKPIHGLYPMKPMFSSQFSSTDVAAFFDGSNTTNSKPIEVIKVTSNRSSTTSDQSFIPTPIFTPNFSALEESLLAGQRRYEQEKARVDNLIANGYVYDPQNNVYYSPENWETIRN